jgi:hypothetical protein
VQVRGLIAGNGGRAFLLDGSAVAHHGAVLYVALNEVGSVLCLHGKEKVYGSIP